MDDNVSHRQMDLGGYTWQLVPRPRRPALPPSQLSRTVLRRTKKQENQSLTTLPPPHLKFPVTMERVNGS